MKKDIIIGKASFNVEQAHKMGHSLWMKIHKESELPKGILAQAEAALFPEEVAEREEEKEEKAAARETEKAEKPKKVPAEEAGEPLTDADSEMFKSVGIDPKTVRKTRKERE